MINQQLLWVCLCLCMGVCSSCRGCHGHDHAGTATDSARKGGANGLMGGSPPGYDLGKPKKYVVSESLHEISGICMLRGNPDTLYAIEDEKGKLFHFHLGGNRFPSVKFGPHGDYEDVTILNDAEFVVLRSDGSLFVFPLGDSKAVQSYLHILPRGEYEGLCSVPSGVEKSTPSARTANDGPSDEGPGGLQGDAGGKLIALCKNCAEDDQRDEVSGYVLQYGAGHKLGITDHFKVRLPSDKLHSIHSKIKFHPSALARHPVTGEWYILSSVNKVLVVLDDHWTVKGMYDLDPKLYKQPEGLAFDRRGNMFISNEGVQGNANVLYFAYAPATP